MMDSHLWLEDRSGAQAVAWAQKESAETKNLFEKDPRFARASREILNILADADKLAMVSLRDGFAYNLWQDETHPRGVWRRTPLASYKSEHPQWETLLDMDALAAKENEPWVFRGCTHLPGSDRCLVRLSKNNQDATEEREFSLTSKAFVKGGFFIPESKSVFEWLDQDHALVSLALTDDQLTTSGYARKVYLWKRGEELSQAQRLYEGQKNDVLVWPFVIRDQGRSIALVGRYVKDDLVEKFVLQADGTLAEVPIPKDAGLSDIFHGMIFFSTRSTWNGFPAGSLLSVPFSVVGQKEIAVDQIKSVFQPSARSALAGIASTRERIYLAVNENVRGQVYEANLDFAGNWHLAKVFNSSNTFSITTAEADGDAAIFQEEGFLQPRRLILREGAKITPLKEMKSYFNESLFVTEQLWVKSKDGVEIPYTVVRARSLVYDGKNPTWLSGYGGFRISRVPFYSPVMGKEWLEKGGVYVIANIRGGGEFGPEWHKAARR